MWEISPTVKFGCPDAVGSNIIIFYDISHQFRAGLQQSECPGVPGPSHLTEAG